MIPTSLHLLLLLLTLLSMRYWFRLYRTKRISSVFQLTPHRSDLEISVPVILAVLWITLQLTSTISNVIEQKPDVTRSISLNDIIGSCALTFAFGTVLILILTLQNSDAMQNLGFRLNHKREQLRDGSVAFLLALIPVMALLLLTHSFRSEETMHPFFQLLKEHPQFSTISWIFISAVLIAPLFEELIYRVIFQSWLENLLPPFAAILISSLVFSIVHGFPDCIPLFPLAFTLGTLFYYRRSYAAVVITHALFNGINLALALANQSPTS